MSQISLWIHTPFAQALGWTLVHFVWEGAALAVVLMAMLRVFRAEPAQRRYTLACLVLAAMPLGDGSGIGGPIGRSGVAVLVAGRA